MKKLTALLLAVMMVMALCACGGSDDSSAAEDAAEIAAEPAAEPDAAAPGSETADAAEEPAAGEASGEPSGEPSGEMDVESYMPDEGDYAKDFEGYRQYCRDGYLADAFHPAELEEETLAEIDGATEDNYTECTNWTNIIDLGVVLSYEDFLAY